MSQWENKIKRNDSCPLKLCTFSRVMKEKGIEIAIEAVSEANERLGYTAFTLDIFGQVETNYVERFNKIKDKFPSYIHYMGIIPYDQSTNVLKEYFALLFLTYYSGEGLAGTLLDAVAAGVPVIASDWKYNREFVIPNKTGILIKDCTKDKAASILLQLLKNQIEWNNMKQFCINEAGKYRSEVIITTILKRLV